MKSVVALLQKGLNLTGCLHWLPPLIGRITIAVVFIEAGWRKLNSIPKVVGFFTNLGIPMPMANAVLVANTEFICGLAVLLGLCTRLASIPLVVIMTVALMTAKRAAIEGPSDIFEISEFLFIVILVWLIIEGAGAFSLDRRLWKKLKS